MATLYTLNYDNNGGPNAPPPPQTFSSSNSFYSFTITEQVPIRIGYKFFCWSKDKNADYDSLNKFFATQSITVLDDNPTVTLYAVWVEIPESIGTSNASNISQDIHLEDKDAWIQFISKWKDNDFSGAITSLGSSQFDTKKMISYVFNTMCNKIVELQGHGGEKAAVIPLSSEQPTTQNNNEMWFRVIASVTKTFGDVDQKKTTFGKIDELNMTFNMIDKGEW